MFGSAILDVAIGIVFVFLLLSLICSAAIELIEMVLKKRAKDLEHGIKELIGDSTETGKFVQAIYDHGLVNGLFRGTYATTPKTKLPSYIPAQNFALAFLEIRKQWTEGKTLPLPNNVRTACDAFEKSAGGDAAKLQKGVESWYNSAMDRVSGWYKRRTQVFLMVMGVVVAIVVNADCIEIAKRLSSDESLRQGIVAVAQAAGSSAASSDDKSKPIEVIQDNLKNLNGLGLPVGWDFSQGGILGTVIAAVPGHWLGWLITALAVSLGAPFWFDILNRFMLLRSTVKPSDKTPENAAGEPNIVVVQPNQSSAAASSR